MISERKGGFVVKAQDRQFWELLVLLETSVRDCREDISPCPTGEVDFCLLQTDGDCLLLCCYTVPKLVLGRTRLSTSVLLGLLT